MRVIYKINWLYELRKLILVLIIVFVLVPFQLFSEVVSAQSVGAGSKDIGILQTGARAAPQISVAPAIYYPLDETLYLEGRAEPKSRVELVFEKPGSNQVRLVVDSNSNGEWFLAQKLELGSGEWMVRARLPGDPPSDWSNPRLIQSRITGFVIGQTRIKYAPVAVVLVLLFLLGGGLLIYSFLRVKAVKRMAHERELREGMEKLEHELRAKDREAAQVALEQNFSEIRKSILDELEHLESKVNSGTKLSAEEGEHRVKLLRELREAEEAIQGKLKEIK